MSKIPHLGNKIVNGAGLSQLNIVNEDYTTHANTNVLFFGTVTFNETVTVGVSSEMILFKPEVDFKKTVDIKGTLNWIT